MKRRQVKYVNYKYLELKPNCNHQMRNKTKKESPPHLTRLYFRGLSCKLSYLSVINTAMFKVGGMRKNRKERG